MLYQILKTFLSTGLNGIDKFAAIPSPILHCGCQQPALQSRRRIKKRSRPGLTVAALLQEKAGWFQVG